MKNQPIPNRALDLVGILRGEGLRITPQRIAICRALTGRHDHPTAQNLYDELRSDFPTISLTTVYQTLDTLSRLGAITSLGRAGDDTIHYEVNTEPHINLVCRDCNQIFDLPSQGIRLLEQEVRQKLGIAAPQGKVVYYVHCNDHVDLHHSNENPRENHGENHDE
ncbi:MAG: transcriptional repressor [Spirochaetales bacterium]|nr:transcriptional repressor [Spirochaetales bacterium]